MYTIFMQERHYLALLYSFSSFGPKRTTLLIDYFGSAEIVWRASERELVKVGIKSDTAQKFRKYQKEVTEEEFFKNLKERNINFVTILDKNYPENLKDLDDAPLVLYYIGKLKKRYPNAVAIIGSRKMTSYGKEVATRFANELAGLGVTIVSGLARGVDTTAHKACLLAKGKTLAVLAGGLDKIYPPENKKLAEKVIKKGALISEFPPGFPSKREYFASRNRIISGISRAVVVVEGEQKSGTLLTASHAAKQGREVFAVPGQITSPLSAAPHILLKNGVRIVTEVKDILEELNLQFGVDTEKIEEVMPSDEVEAKILELVTNEPLHMDEIGRAVDKKISQVLTKLTMMEMKGMIVQTEPGFYKKR